MADERAKQDELSFKKSERQFLKLILRICKYKGKLKTLKISDIDIKPTRMKSDNLLVKTQGLQNMKDAQVPPEIAFTICGLFSDPNDVYAKAKAYYGDDFWKSESPFDKDLDENGQKENQNINNISADEGKKSATQNEGVARNKASVRKEK